MPKSPHLPKISRVLRSHHKWLALFGALIIFATFVLKDVLRDNYKDLSDSVAHAESVFAIRNDVQIVRSDQEIFQTDKVEDEAAYGLQINQRIRSAGIALSQISGLLKELPSDTVDGAELKKLQREQAEERGRGFTLAAERLAHTADPDHTWRTSAVLALLELAGRNRLLSVHTNELGARVIRSAAAEEESDRSWYESFRRWTYSLFAIGWILLVVGRVYDIEDVSGLA